ncbi:MAG TPA: hypothetical protein VMG10_10695 [Gemmataceae bacterium]|nr:hypothetical protein [Gemmataceae bacterium]
MNEADLGKVFLFALPWDWTFVGRFEGFIGERIVIAEAGYFTRTGATFDRLCKEGFAPDTQFHAIKTAGGRCRVPNGGLIFPWEAAWPQREARLQ